MTDQPTTHRTTPTPDGVTLWSQAFGSPDDPPLLLIMGANASAMVWPDEFVELLVDHGLHVLRYDHRDTGRSTHREVTDYSLEDMARDAIAVLDGHGIDTAHVVGLSMGGTLGQVLALDHRQRLRSLTLMVTAGLDVDFVASMHRAANGESAPGDLPGPTPEIVDAMSHRAEPVKDRETALRRRIAEWRILVGNDVLFDEETFRRWEARAIDHAGSFQQPGAHTFATPVPVSRGAELSEITTPTLVIQGPLDPINPPPHGQHLADQIPGARCVEIPGLGHALPSPLHQSIIDAITHHIGQCAGR